MQKNILQRLSGLKSETDAAILLFSSIQSHWLNLNEAALDKYLIIITFLLYLSSPLASAHGLMDTTGIRVFRDTSMPSHFLKEIVVKSFKIKNKTLRSPTPVQVMNQETLHRLNSLSVADAVRYFSGVQLKDYGGIGGLKTINVRSLGTHHTTVFYDGMPLGNAQNGQVDLGRFSLTNLKEIKLYQAQSNQLFLPAKAFASGATLYLKSRTPTFKEDGKTNLRTAFKTGSFGLVNPSIHWEQKISKKLSGSLSTAYTYANGKYPFRYTNGVYDTTAIRHNAELSAWRMEMGLYGSVSDSSFWRLHAYHYQSERGLPGAVVSNHFENYQRLENEDQFVQGKWKQQVNKWYVFKVNLKWAQHHTHYVDPFYPNAAGKLENTYKEQVFYSSIANHFRLSPFWDATISVDYQLDHLDADLYHFPYPTRHTVLSVVASKLHFPHFNLQGSLLGTFVKDEVEKYSGAGQKSEYTPTLSASWQPFHKLGLWFRGFYKNIFRMPTFNDLYYTFVGNTQLRPEYAQQWDIGLTYHKMFEKGLLKYTALTVDAYHNRVKDKIIATPGTNLFRWTMANLGKVDIKGIDVHLDNQLLVAQQFFMKIGVSYTYQQALDVTDRGYHYKNQIPYAPQHSGSLTAAFNWKKWTLNYSFIYTGERYSHLSNTYQDYIPAWYTHDISLNRKIKLKNVEMKVSAEVNNLANQHYDVIQNFPMPGRSYRLGLSVHLL